jgi:hypothetical protein
VYTYYSSGAIKTKLIGSAGVAYEYYESTGYMSTEWASYSGSWPADWTGDDVIKQFTNESYLSEGYGKLQWEMNPSNDEMFVYENYFTGTRVPQYRHYYYRNVGTDVWDYSVSDEYAAGAGGEWLYQGTYTVAAREGTSITRTVPAKPVDTSGSYIVPETMDVGVTMQLEDYESEEVRSFYDKVDEVRRSYTGEGVKIALLDSGLDDTYISNGNIIAGYDFAGSDRFDGAGDADYSDDTGHGTVTGGATLEAAPDAEFIVGKVLDEEEKTTAGIVADSIRYAVDLGADIISMPFSLNPLNDDVKAALDAAYAKGVVLITAAGNESGDIFDNSLAAYDNVITVGSVDNDGNISAWSNFDSELDLLAPWDVIRSGDGEAAEKQGTSLSAAFVAGVAALVKEQDPEATVEDVLARIKEMTKLIDEKNNVYGDFTFMADNTEQDAEVSGEESGKVEDKEEDKIKGEDIDEVTSRYEAIRQSMQQFTGHNIVMDSYFTKETQK